MNSTIRFLGIFDNTPPGGAAPSPQQPQQTAATEATVPVTALPGILQAAQAAERAAQQEVERAKQIQAQVQAARPQAPTPAPSPAPLSNDTSNAELAREMRKLRQEVEAANAAAAAAQLEVYRQQALAAARVRGLDPAFDGYVHGPSPQEIDAAVNVALAQQQEAQARWTSALIKQHGGPPQQAPGALSIAGAPPPVQQPPVPVGYTQAVAPVSAPSMVQAPPQVQQPNPLAQLPQFTSREAIRSGAYGQNRAAIHAALRGNPPPVQNFALNQQHPSYAVPAPVPMQGAMQHTPVAGQYVPQYAPAQPPVGPAPAPGQVEASGGRFDANAARAAAMASVQANRPN